MNLRVRTIDMREANDAAGKTSITSILKQTQPELFAYALHFNAFDEDSENSIDKGEEADFL